MLDYIKGSIAELNPAYVVLDNHGLGYMINISLSTYDALAKLPSMEVARLYVHEAIREDAHLLYGFADKHERELFLLLISVSGVGVNTARMILSSLPAVELEKNIASGNASVLKSVKGVGAKTAQRIIVDLKDKIKVAGDTLIEETGEASGVVFEEAMAALVMLGFTQQMSQKALKKLFKQEPNISVEDAIKKALKMM
ncbi:Holliday junction branch migration protein RuvA [Sodaliphilus sp.]|uniref:Holliday junction branch migration protein RuvA n=1 Tax=Sodaliphilus sp. TaxID=2815818 RepID=UPI00388FCAF9